MRFGMPIGGHSGSVECLKSLKDGARKVEERG